jgi:uncharacterized membrane protein YdjX (TVP38/TMEM64 family)
MHGARARTYCVRFVQVSAHREHLLNYMLFLRITPFLPNWFINIAAPVIDVPLRPFFIGTFLGAFCPISPMHRIQVMCAGVAPPSFVFVQMGKTLQQLTSTSVPLSYTSVGLLALFAVGSLVPVLLRNRLKSKLT